VLRIAQLLEEEGRRKTWLARRIGVGPTQLSRMLTGERPWTAKRRELALAALGRGEGDRLFEEVGADDGGSGAAGG
jgi:transcriptional regulator with XRE-family HTH domain